jgi:hypothetical protein
MQAIEDGFTPCAPPALAAHSRWGFQALQAHCDPLRCHLRCPLHPVARQRLLHRMLLPAHLADLEPQGLPACTLTAVRTSESRGRHTARIISQAAWVRDRAYESYWLRTRAVEGLWRPEAVGLLWLLRRRRWISSTSRVHLCQQCLALAALCLRDLDCSTLGSRKHTAACSRRLAKAGGSCCPHVRLTA